MSPSSSRREPAIAAPTLTVSVFRVLLTTAVGLGLPREELLSAAGVSEADLLDSDRRLPLSAQLAVGRLLIRERPGQNVGLLVLRNAKPRSFGALGYALQHSGSLHDALKTFMRYQTMLTDAASWRLQGGRVRVGVHPSLSELSHPTEAMVGVAVSLGRALTGQPWVPLSVSFRHQPLGDPCEHEAFFGVAPRFGAEHDELRLDPAQLALPVQGAQVAVLPGLRILLDAKLPQETQSSTCARVLSALREQLPRDRGDKSSVARALGVSPRTLSRRLRAEETSFQELLDEARAELACHWLRDPQLAVYEIAFLLGYSEPSAFHRAFRRWTGQAPAEWREAVRR